MNIWVLDESPSDAARYHCDRHVSAGINELAWMLSAAHVMCDTMDVATKRSVPLHLRNGFLNHPCARWVRESQCNYDWTTELLQSLTFQFQLRFQRGHEFHWMVQDWKQKRPLNLPMTGVRTPFVQSMPVEFRMSNAVESYRDYYVLRVVNSDLARWSVVGMPRWWTEKLAWAMKEKKHG